MNIHQVSKRKRISYFFADRATVAKINNETGEGTKAEVL